MAHRSSGTGAVAPPRGRGMTTPRSHLAMVWRLDGAPTWLWCGA